jgi:hypothetical protein
VDLNSIYHAIEYGGNEDEIKSKTLSVFADWSHGTYGSGPDTDIFILCPRTTEGTVVLEGNHKRLMMVFKAALKYSREGMPIHLEAFTPPWVTNRPLGERAAYLFDKNTMYKQHRMRLTISVLPVAGSRVRFPTRTKGPSYRAMC